MENIKSCVACKHCKSNISETQWYCFNGDIDLVTGNPITLCGIMRENRLYQRGSLSEDKDYFGICGPEGKLFEEKPKKSKPIIDITGSFPWFVIGTGLLLLLIVLR
jgi:hypothetical protein